MKNDQYIKQEALPLQVGESAIVYCCFCDNEPPYRPSLSISRNEAGVLYNCFRACCSKSGFMGSLPSELQKEAPKKTFIPKPFKRVTEELPDDLLLDIEEVYGIHKNELTDNGIKYIPDGQGLLMPLYNVDGYCYGHTTKYFRKDLKAIHYLETDTSKLAFINPRFKTTTVIIVEDILSAIRVHRFGQGVALLGTHLNDDMVKDLIKAGYRNLIIALDPDALLKATKMRQHYGLFFNTVKVISLSNDPKNLTHEQLKKELQV